MQRSSLIMSKTIKELADELQVSKQTIRYHLKSIPVKFTSKDSKNRIVIKPSGEKLIRAKVTNNTGKTTGKAIGNIPDTYRNKDEFTGKDQEALINKRLDDLEKLYHEQLTSKEDEIKRLHEALNRNQNLLDQSQRLQLMAEKKIEKLETPNENNKKEASEKETPEVKQEKSNKKPWWKF